MTTTVVAATAATAVLWCDGMYLYITYQQYKYKYDDDDDDDDDDAQEKKAVFLRFF